MPLIDVFYALFCLWLMGAGTTFLGMMILFTNEELPISGAEAVVWVLFWPVCHTVAVAKFLAKGIVGLWKRV